MPTTKKKTAKKKKKKKKKKTIKKKAYTKKKEVARQTIQCKHCQKVSEVAIDDLTLINTIHDEVIDETGRVAIRYDFYVTRCPKCNSSTASRKVIYRD